MDMLGSCICLFNSLVFAKFIRFWNHAKAVVSRWNHSGRVNNFLSQMVCSVKIYILFTGVIIRFCYFLPRIIINIIFISFLLSIVRALTLESVLRLYFLYIFRNCRSCFQLQFGFLSSPRRYAYSWCRKSGGSFQKALRYWRQSVFSILFGKFEWRATSNSKSILWAWSFNIVNWNIGWVHQILL